MELLHQIIPISGGIAGAAVFALSGWYVMKSLKRREWQGKCNEEDPLEKCEPSSRYCRKIKLDTESAKDRVISLILYSDHSSVNEDRTIITDHDIIDRLNYLATEYRKRANSDRFMEQLMIFSRKIAERVIYLLRKRNDTTDISIISRIERSDIKCQFILYHCRQRGDASLWEEEDKWKAKVKDTYDAFVGNLQELDITEIRLSDKLTLNLKTMIMKFIQET